MNKDDLRNIQTSQKYVIFYFPYTWIKDKQIIHKGNEIAGMLIIADDEDNVLKMFGYELVEANNKF